MKDSKERVYYILAEEEEQERKRKKITMIIFFVSFLIALGICIAYLIIYLNTPTENENMADYLDVNKNFFNVDTNDDGIPDFNLINNNGLNIDYDGDNIPDINIDLNGDGIAEVNLTNRTVLNYSNILFNKDNNFDGFPDANIDLNGDLICDYNCEDDLPTITLPKINNDDKIASYSFRYDDESSLKITYQPNDSRITKVFSIRNNSLKSLSYRVFIKDISSKYDLSLITYKVKCLGINCGEIEEERSIASNTKITLFTYLICPPQTVQEYTIIINNNSEEEINLDTLFNVEIEKIN